MLHRNLRGR